MVKKKRGDTDLYRMRTRLIHGTFHSKHWDYNHHIIPPMSASAAYRLDSVHRGAQGFTQFASDEADRDVPIYIYDRLHEPTRGLLKKTLPWRRAGGWLFALPRAWRPSARL